MINSSLVARQLRCQCDQRLELPSGAFCQVIVEPSLVQKNWVLPLAVANRAAEQVTDDIRRPAAMICFSFPKLPDCFSLFDQHWWRPPPEIASRSNRLRFNLSHHALR